MLRWIGLAIALTLGSMSTTAWAKAPEDVQMQVSPTQLGPKAPVPAQARTSQGQAYASREASSSNQAKFEGGSTVVWVGGSSVVVVLLVILIVVLI
jgi:cobalamin biosynthesis Mg chelatase CobN